MIRFGLDSTGMVPVSGHHAVGSTVALRYLSRSTYKVVTKAEHDAYKAAGIDLVLVFEDSGRPDLAGHQGGVDDAQFALRQATQILGTPTLPPVIRFAADYDPAGNPAATDAYYDGVATIIPRERCGPYGGLEVVSRQANRGFKALWQTYAWSGGRFDSRAQVYQYSNDHTVAGVGVDFNHCYGVDFGQWDRTAPAPVDPHHYLWFETQNIPFGQGHLTERNTVTEYDQLRPHAVLHARRLGQLREDCRFLAERIVLRTLQEAGNQPRNWEGFHRSWRVKQLWARYQGKQVV